MAPSGSTAGGRRSSEATTTRAPARRAAGSTRPCRAAKSSTWASSPPRSQRQRVLWMTSLAWIDERVQRRWRPRMPTRSRPGRSLGSGDPHQRYRRRRLCPRLRCRCPLRPPLPYQSRLPLLLRHLCSQPPRRQSPRCPCRARPSPSRQPQGSSPAPCRRRRQRARRQVRRSRRRWRPPSGRRYPQGLRRSTRCSSSSWLVSPSL
mmetsp:Transcript_26256/g.74690  ORF Transcript_26256/g.74690 Transcript_26256/m.74690 type:complete len:205 (+) Transcript_26256:273-887(+)